MMLILRWNTAVECVVSCEGRGGSELWEEVLWKGVKGCVVWLCRVCCKLWGERGGSELWQESCKLWKERRLSVLQVCLGCEGRECCYVRGEAEGEWLGCKRWRWEVCCRLWWEGLLWAVMGGCVVSCEREGCDVRGWVVSWADGMFLSCDVRVFCEVKGGGCDVSCDVRVCCKLWC